MKKAAIIFFISIFAGGMLVAGMPTKARAADAQQPTPPNQDDLKNAQNPNEEGLSLTDCYRLALKQSEKVAIRQELIQEAEGRFVQYINKILPQVSFEMSEKRQNGTGGSAFTLREVPESKFVFSQPLFSGFREFAVIAANRRERQQRIQEKIRAEQLLFIDVADAFYFFLSYQEDYRVLEKMREAWVERVMELKKREALGRSRLSEVASAEAQLRRAEADLESVTSDREVARQLLEFLTGYPVTAVIDSPVATEPLSATEEYAAKTARRPDVLAAQAALAIAKKQMIVARSGFWPTVNLEGNYYTKRVGASAGVDWDATLNITAPITSVGENAGKVKEAKAKQNQAELKLSEVRRQATLEIKNAYTQLQMDMKRSDALHKALSAAEKSYQLQTEDYRLNLVNNLEVLQALEDLQEVRREYNIVQNETKRAYWKLKVMIGEIPNDTF